MSDTSASLRTTQRVPRSCIPCSSRKVKCDKGEPCVTCVRRGESSLCVRETVLIRGEPKTSVSSPNPRQRARNKVAANRANFLSGRWQETRRVPTPDSESLMQEIVCLKAELRAFKDAQNSHVRLGIAQGPRKGRQLENRDSMEDSLWDSISSNIVASRSNVVNWDDVVLPARSLSSRLVAYDRTWNSWVHYALEYPRFQHECDAFMDAMDSGVSLGGRDPFWMAVYFSVISTALLMMDEEEAAGVLASQHVAMDVRSLCRNWYDAAIFCLYRAEFMRVPHICTVQSIAILGMCFNILGDVDLYQHLWSIAIRVAQRLGLNTPSSQKAGALTPEAQHRLWWTLTICEWLKDPNEPTQIEEVDFDVPLPCPLQTSVTGRMTNLDPAHYHLFMARTSTVYNRFCQSLRRSALSLEDIVKAADEELALVIDTLPNHLQPDLGITEGVRELELSQPWIKWQRFDITLVLLQQRVRINRTLQRHWLSSPGRYDWARAVCISSSLEIIWISRNWDQPVSMRKQWALSLHLFVASILLLREWRSSYDGRGREYEEAIEVAISILKQVQSENEIARHAVRILRNNLPIPHPY